MRGKGMVALGRLVLSKRERVIALEPYDKGLLGTTLRYPYEVRKAEDYFCDLPDLAIAPDMRKLAEHILASTVPSRLWAGTAARSGMTLTPVCAPGLPGLPCAALLLWCPRRHCGAAPP